MSLPKPYYSEAGITIYHADCRAILPHLPKVDLVLTDPPYGVGLVAFNDDFSLALEAIPQCNADIAAVFMSPRRIIELANGIAGSWDFERALWMEKSADISFPWRGWLMNSEAILLFSKPESIWPTPERYSRDCYRVGPWGKNGHPNAKPPEVIEDILAKICRATVLDPFMGSGTTLRAAKDLGRKAIGIEIEEKYCAIAVERLRQEVLNL